MIFIKTGDFVNKVKPYLQKAAFLQILNFKPVKVSKMDCRGQSDQGQIYIEFFCLFIRGVCSFRMAYNPLPYIYALLYLMYHVAGMTTIHNFTI